MKKFLFFLLLLVVSMAVVPLFLPKVMYVEEEYIYENDVDTVYNYFYDMQKLSQFDGWLGTDSLVNVTYSKPTYGENAYYAWESNLQQLGKGKMQIIDYRLDEFITYKLDIEENPTSTVEVVFQKIDDAKTKVIWSYESGETHYPFQIYNILMKKTFKGKIHESLLKLSNILHEKQKDEVKPFQIKNIAEKKLFGVLQSTSFNKDELETSIKESLATIKSYLIDAQGLSNKNIGKPVVYWKLYDEENDKAMFYCGYFITAKVPEVDGMEYTDVNGGQVLQSIHTGSYDSLPTTFAQMRKYAEEQGIYLSSEIFTIFLNDLYEENNELRLKTEIDIPIIE